jgi:hypothetical protein
MRTTISLPDHVLAQAKRRATEEKLTLSEFVEAAVRERVLRGATSKKTQAFRLVTFGEGGLQPGRSWDGWKTVTDEDQADKLKLRAPGRIVVRE